MMGVGIMSDQCRIAIYNCGLGPKLSDKSMVFRDVASSISTAGAVCFIGLLLIMAGIEPNPGPKGTHDRNNPLCKNWNRVAYGYRYLKTGLTDFISSQVCSRHTDLKQEVDHQCHDVKPCSGCTTDTLLPDHGTLGCNQQQGSICLCQQDPGTRKKCPNNFCGRFYHHIVDDHVENSPRWSSADPTKWYNDFFQYAKCFLSVDSTANSVSDLDCTDLLTIVIHNKYIHNSVDEVKSFQQCLEDRNKIFHSGSFEVTDSELDNYIDNMIGVLEDKTCLINNLDAQQAVKELNKLKNDQIEISDKDIDGLLNKIESENTFIFRCQYLLIEIGTKVLRHIFDDRVGQNFGHYLLSTKDKNNKLEGDKLQALIKQKKSIITAAQTKFLPPKDMKPSSANFDITLLTCLLRNVCGMGPSGDQVWMHPNGNDYSTEADITRLRKCRNDLAHSDTVSISKTDFNAKWDELCRILNRLNQGLTANKITNLQSLINDSQHLCIDEKQQKGFNTIIEAWEKLDGDVIAVVEQCTDRIEQGVKRGFDSVQQILIKEVKKPRMENETDIQQELKEKYKTSCTTITVSPLFSFQKEDLLNLYKIPTFFLTECSGALSTQKDTEVTSCNQIFYKEDQPCRSIYIIGEAGVGKTSFCQFLCLIWYMSKSCIDIVNEEMKEYVEFIGKFDFVFYITLRDSDRIDVIAMIVDQLLFTQSLDEWHKMYSCIKDILKQKECLVILDGLDEWRPDARGKKDISIPSRTFSEKCVFLTTCRPYKTENLQLHKDLDHQMKITGITGKSSTDYIKDVVGYINKKNGENKDPKSFKTEVIECGLGDMLCIPIISSNLIFVWFEQKLTNMSRTLIYGKIVDMLFEMAVKRKIEFPPSTASELQLPDSLSKLNYINKHVSLLQKVCLLSFRSLFTQDECVATLVFTRQQLESDPYFLSSEQMDLLCKIGILSKNTISRRFGKQEQKLNFLHLSYLEFFAALFVSSFDRNNIFTDVVKNWTALNQILPFKNFFLFLAGFSIQTVDQLFSTVYPLISKDLTVIRRNTVFHYHPKGYNEQLKSLQSIVISCIKESRRSSDANVFIKLEDFYFEDFYFKDTSNIEILKPLIELNKTCIKSVYAENGKYFDIFDQIKNLQCLNVGKVLPADYKKFTQFILENESTLNTVCIKGDSDTKPFIPELPVRGGHRLSSFFRSIIRRPVRSLQHLTSLSLSHVKMHHNSLHNLVQFLSGNVLIENIKLSSVYCDNHQDDDRACTLTLNLPHHKQLASLCLWRVNILCNKVNKSSLKSIILGPFSERIVRPYIDVFNCVKDSQLECLRINGYKWLDHNAVRTLIHTVNTLPCIKALALQYMKLPDDVLLQLHPHVTQVLIQLYHVTMSRQYFHSFIESFVNNQTVIEVKLYECKITSVDGETHRELSVQDSLDYMSDNLTSIPTVNILYKGRYKGQGLDGLRLAFETKSCQ